eukprot:11785245-Alexandrium_andersonii.AAC.1
MRRGRPTTTTRTTTARSATRARRGTTVVPGLPPSSASRAVNQRHRHGKCATPGPAGAAPGS